MTEEIKKMIESVERYGTRQITRYSLERAKAGLTEKRFVRESDFDRVVEELTKWNKAEKHLNNGKMTQQEFFEREILANICTIGFNGEIRKRCSKCGDYQTPIGVICPNCKTEYDIAPITVKDALISTSHLKFGLKAHYVAALNLGKLKEGGYTENEFINYCNFNYNIQL